jgi:hypothetical protein
MLFGYLLGKLGVMTVTVSVAVVPIRDIAAPLQTAVPALSDATDCGG